MHLSRANFGIAQLNNYIYVIGGYNDKLGTLRSCEVIEIKYIKDHGCSHKNLVADCGS
jgi:Kelch motif